MNTAKALTPPEPREGSTQLSNLAKNTFLLSCLLFLSACGFHLRGLVPIPPWLDQIYVQAPDSNKDFVTLLESQLELNHIHLSPDPALARYWLMIDKINLQQQIVSIGASTNPRQYQLTLTVSFVLQTPKGQILGGVQTLSVGRQLTVNNDRILGSDYEEGLFVSEMKKEACAQIINRLSRMDNVY